MCGSGGTVCIHVYIVLQYYLNCLIMFLTFWGAEGAPILFSVLGFSMASCS